VSNADASAPTRDIYTISRLNREARMLLDSGFGTLWVEGELSNLARPSSGHWYFSLKDRDAQLRCAMWRARNALTRFAPKDGQKVLVRGRVSLYEPRGEYQLIVEHIEDAGLGALQRAFEELKAQLQTEGLFALERKRPLPTLPLRIGVITSPTGAALRDVLHVLAQRFPAASVLIYPVPVQGAAAVPAIVAALDLANARAECEVLIVARGGGSIEDLWAFNDERVARALARSRLPVVTGIGHEVDFTIADFVADVRAPTPSGAAQLVVPEYQVWLQRFRELGARIATAMRRALGDRDLRLRSLTERLQRAHPGTQLTQHAQRLDELEQRLQRAMRERLARASTQLQATARSLHALSPLATLSRGFAIVTRVADGAVLRASTEATVGDEIDARLGSGVVRARVVAMP
jgi:exodeoxyribonuclease VII large subunit